MPSMDCRFSMQSLNAPCPGRTMRSALRISLGLLLILTVMSLFKCSNALAAERMLPEP